MRPDVRPAFQWPEVPGAGNSGTAEGGTPAARGSEGPARESTTGRDPLPPTFLDPDAPIETLWHERHEDVYGEPVDIRTPIEEPREWAEVLADLAIVVGILLAGFVVGFIVGGAW